jgi:hypothetical protein
MSKQVLELTPDERKSWLNDHLPNRVGAAWVWLPDLKGDWEWKSHRDFAENADRNQVWCIGRAAEHGQKTAMRWLIEFLGVCFDSKKREPCRPARRRTDVSIQSFVDDGSDLQIVLDKADRSSEAWILADVWQGCSQSCVHSTIRTNHPRADPPQLAKALQIIVEHLQRKLYGSESLSRIVRDKN